MTKKEFMKLEKKHGLDYAVEQLALELNETDYFDEIWHTDTIINNLHESIDEWEFNYAYAVLDALIDNKKFVDGKHNYWKKADGKYLFEPIKSIKDIEEFLEDEGGMKNE